jgi:regulator of sigma E protease
MELLSSFTGFGGSMLGYIVPFLFVLTIVVFFHELGHFLVARWCGVTVQTFSIGFGPEIFGWNDRKGTRWRFSWIPLGGYVKFLDDTDATSALPDKDAAERMSPEQLAGSFHRKSVWRRIAVVAAGPLANFILAIVIFTGMFAIVGQQITSARVDTVAEDSAAAEAGFQPGDVILQIDGTKIESFADMQRIVSGAAGDRLEIIVERGGQPITLTATPRFEEVTDRFGNAQRIGLLGIARSVDPESLKLVRYSPPTAFIKALDETYFIIERTMVYIYDVIVGRQAADQLGGPIRIAEVSGQVATLGLLALIQMSAVLSISIGLINLFPIPVLDGGNLLFYAIEAVRGRPLSDTAQEYGFRVGLALLLMLMVFVTWNDIARILGRMVGA